MKPIFLLTICTLLLSTLSSDHYYTGFTETLGLDTHITNDGIDCTEPVSRALYHFQGDLNHLKKNPDAFFHAIVEIVDKLKYEVSPLCRVFYGDFAQFMSEYYGDAEGLKDAAERNLYAHYKFIEETIQESFAALKDGDDYEAGRSHAYLLRVFLDLEKNVPQAGRNTVKVIEEAVENEREEKVKVVLLDEIVEVSGYEEVYEDETVKVLSEDAGQDQMDEQINYDVAVEVRGDEEEYSGVEVQRITETEVLGEEVVGVFVDIAKYYQSGDSGSNEDEEREREKTDDYEEEEEEEEETGKDDGEEYLRNDYDYYLDLEGGIQVQLVSRRMLSQIDHGYDYDL